MVAIYLNNQVAGSHGTYGTTSLFRIYDADEVPENLTDRVQGWANRLNQRFSIRDLTDPSTMSTTDITPQNE